MKFSIKDFCSKCDQIRSFLRIWSHLLKKSLMENFIFCAVLLDHEKDTHCRNYFLFYIRTQETQHNQSAKCITPCHLYSMLKSKARKKLVNVRSRTAYIPITTTSKFILCFNVFSKEK